MNEAPFFNIRYSYRFAFRTWKFTTRKFETCCLALSTSHRRALYACASTQNGVHMLRVCLNTK